MPRNRPTVDLHTVGRRREDAAAVVRQTASFLDRWLLTAAVDPLLVRQDLLVLDDDLAAVDPYA